MANLFFRTSIAPYRIDIYNALHERLGCEMYFYYSFDSSQKLNEEGMRRMCHFTPTYLKGITFGEGETRKFCTEVWKILRRHKPEIVIVPEFQLLTIQVILYKFLFRKQFIPARARCSPYSACCSLPDSTTPPITPRLPTPPARSPSKTAPPGCSRCK